MWHFSARARKHDPKPRNATDQQEQELAIAPGGIGAAATALTTKTRHLIRWRPPAVTKVH